MILARVGRFVTVVHTSTRRNLRKYNTIGRIFSNAEGWAGGCQQSFTPERQVVNGSIIIKIFKYEKSCCSFYIHPAEHHAYLSSYHAKILTWRRCWCWAPILTFECIMPVSVTSLLLEAFEKPSVVSQICKRYCITHAFEEVHTL